LINNGVLSNSTDSADIGRVLRSDAIYVSPLSDRRSADP
jgi:hypothetical protein